MVFNFSQNTLLFNPFDYYVIHKITYFDMLMQLVLRYYFNVSTYKHKKESFCSFYQKKKIDKIYKQQEDYVFKQSVTV